jgi:hypothetical protein
MHRYRSCRHLYLVKYSGVPQLSKALTDKKGVLGKGKHEIQQQI